MKADSRGRERSVVLLCYCCVPWFTENRHRVVSANQRRAAGSARGSRGCACQFVGDYPLVRLYVTCPPRYTDFCLFSFLCAEYIDIYMPVYAWYYSEYTRARRVFVHRWQPGGSSTRTSTHGGILRSSVSQPRPT